MLWRWGTTFLFRHIVQQLPSKPCVHNCCNFFGIGWNPFLKNIVFLLDSFTDKLANVPLYASIKMVNSSLFIMNGNYLWICIICITFIPYFLNLCTILLCILCIVIIWLIPCAVIIRENTMNFSDNPFKLTHFLLKLFIAILFIP